MKVTRFQAAAFVVLLIASCTGCEGIGRKWGCKGFLPYERQPYSPLPEDLRNS